MIFTVPGPPKGKSRARTVKNRYTGKTVSYTPDDTVLYENLIKTCFMNAGGGILNNKEPVVLRINAFYPVPQSASKKSKEKMLSGEIRPTKKPDADNILKAVNDALNGLAYGDDSQIVCETVIKHYSENPRLEITVQAL